MSKKLKKIKKCVIFYIYIENILSTQGLAAAKGECTMSSQNSMYGEIKEQHQKTKDMSAKGKLSYFWYYYKIHTIALIAIIIFVISLIRQVVTSKDYAFYAALINSDFSYTTDDPWGAEFAEYAGIDTDKYLSSVDTSFMLSNGDMSQYSISSTEKLMAMVQTGGIDVIVADTAIFEGYARNEMFTDLRTVLPEEMLKKYENNLYYTDAASFDEADAGNYQSIEDMPDYDALVINHRDPSSMKQPIPVGICLPEENKIMASGCYDYLSAGNVTYQGYPSEAVLGIPLSATRLDTIILFLEFLEE